MASIAPAASVEAHFHPYHPQKAEIAIGQETVMQVLAKPGGSR
jgi:hypothetical protein